MLFLIFSLFLIPSGQISSQSPDVVSSLIDISQAFVAGRHLSIELTKFLNHEEFRLTKLRELILRLDTALEICNASDANQLAPPLIENKAAANPVSTFLTILQLAANWSNELSVILGVPNMGSDEVDSVNHTDIPVGVYEEFDSRRKLFNKLKWYADMLPDDGDVQGALNAVIRLQQTYNISSIKIAEGRILPSSPSPRLSGKFWLDRLHGSPIKIHMHYYVLQSLRICLYFEMATSKLLFRVRNLKGETFHNLKSLLKVNIKLLLIL